MRKSAIKILALSIMTSAVLSNTALAARQNTEEIIPPAPTGGFLADDLTNFEASVTRTTQKGKHLGKFKTTGYCDSTPEKPRKTSSGVYPKAKHTVAADLSVLPSGSKIRIGESDIIYTVEDTGVYGKSVDIFYETYEIAHSHGEQYLDIYLIE